MIITILSSNHNKREQEWLNHWTDEFQRIGCEVLVNPDIKELDKSDALVLLVDGRTLEPDTYFKLGYFYHLKLASESKPNRLLVAFQEAGDLSNSLSVNFDHITKTEKGLINTVKDYLFFYNKNL